MGAPFFLNRWWGYLRMRRYPGSIAVQSWLPQWQVHFLVFALTSSLTVMSDNDRPNARPRRGRPSGKNRVPLTAEQRRARNALYERERRQGLGKEFSNLAEAVGCSSDIPNYELLEMVEEILKTSKKKEAIEELTEQNRAIENEIAKLEEHIKIQEIKEWLEQPSLADSTHETTSDTTKEELEKQHKKAKEEIARLEEQIQIAEIEKWLLQPF